MLSPAAERSPRALTPPERILTAVDARAYRRFLDWSVGAGFMLGVVQVSEPWRRDALVAWTQAQVPGTRVVRLDQASQVPLRSLLEQAAEPPGEMSVLVLTHLEEASDRRMVCAQLNVQRDDVAKLFAVPWIVVVHPHAVLDLQQHAPDFADFAGMWLGEEERSDNNAGVPLQASADGPMVDLAPLLDAGAPGAELLAAADVALRAGRFDEARDLLARHELVHPEAVGQVDRTLVEGRLLLFHGDLSGARAKYESVLRDCERHHNERGAVFPLFVLGRILSAQGSYGEAEGLLRQALAIRDKAQGKGRPDQGILLANLGGVLYEQGRYAEAEGLLRQALAIMAKTLGEGHASHGASLRVLGNVLAAQGKYEEAEELLRQALGIVGKVLGEGHASRAASLQALAEVLRDQGKRGEAEGLLRQAIGIHEKTVGPGHPSYGASLHALAAVLKEGGKYGEAEGLLRHALAIQQQTLGEDHPDYAASLDTLAGVLREQGKHEQALGLLRRSLEIEEDALGEHHPQVSVTLANLAVNLVEQGRVVEAEPLLQRALRITHAVHGDRHPVTARILNLVAQVQSRLGKPEAHETARRALDSLRATLGPRHPFVGNAALILNSIALGTTEARIRAALDQAKPGDSPSAIRDLEALADEVTAAGADAAEASAREALAQLLAATGQPFLAGVQLRATLGIVERLGDEAAASRLRAKLAALEPGA